MFFSFSDLLLKPLGRRCGCVKRWCRPGTAHAPAARRVLSGPNREPLQPRFTNATAPTSFFTGRVPSFANPCRWPRRRRVPAVSPTIIIQCGAKPDNRRSVPRLRGTAFPGSGSHNPSDTGVTGSMSVQSSGINVGNVGGGPVSPSLLYRDRRHVHCEANVTVSCQSGCDEYIACAARRGLTRAVAVTQNTAGQASEFAPGSRAGSMWLRAGLVCAMASRNGGVAEWLKAHAWKACLRETVTWVRIPPPPPRSYQLPLYAIPQLA